MPALRTTGSSPDLILYKYQPTPHTHKNSSCQAFVHDTRTRSQTKPTQKQITFTNFV